MIKYFAKPNMSAMVSFNTETEEVNAVDYLNTHIDWVYQVPEDGILQVEDGEKNVKKGDFVIKFYNRREYKMTPVVVVKSAEWKNNIKNEKAYEEERRLEWEAKKNEPCCGDCCECEKY